MVRLIDADELKIDYGFTWDDITPTHEELYELIDRQPTIEIVRCGECKHSYDAIGGTFCSYGTCVDCIVDVDFFCQNGERRADNETD